MDPIPDPNFECSNYGCSLKYADREKSPVCQYHSGAPVFHEGYKYWSCCKKKAIDFDEFLRQKGCAEGDHCWTPRPKVEPRTPKDEPIIEVPKEEVRLKMNAMERPDFNSEMVDLQVQISPNFQKQVEARGPMPEDLENKQCQNPGCSVKYTEASANPECLHHPGEAIFHEGLKYWSCCKKKAMEFEEFLKQKGCAKGTHCWTSKKKVECRFDWHQTGSHVIVTIYAKGCSPSGLSIKANGVRLQVSITLPTGVYKKDWTLAGIITENKSSACLLSTKVEITLKKAEPVQWTSFELGKGV